MTRRSPTLAIEEVPGNLYPDLAAAQREALYPLASDLAATIHALLSSGVLVNEAGRIVPRSAKG